jgi:hypothetical protein
MNYIGDKSFGRWKHVYRLTKDVRDLVTVDFSKGEDDRRLKDFLRYLTDIKGIKLTVREDRDLKPICRLGYNGFIDLGGIGGPGFPDVVLCGRISSSILRPLYVEDLSITRSNIRNASV